MDPLSELLRNADAAHVPATVEAASLVQAVRRRAHRRNVVRRGVAGGALMLLVSLGIWRGMSTRQSVPKPVDQQFLIAEIARLEAEIQRTRKLTTLLLAMQNNVAQPEETRSSLAVYRRPVEDFDSYEELVADRLDTAARISVQRADTLRQEFERFDEAAEAYQAVIDHFPKSRWALVAQQQLEKLRPMN